MLEVRKVFILLVLFCSFSLSSASLVHRYSFDSDASDSVGDADGTLVIGNEEWSYVDGRLELGNSSTPNSNGGPLNYVDLPNGTISALGDRLTFETWTTWHGPFGSPWQRIFDFGSSWAGEDIATGGGEYIFLCPSSGGPNKMRVAFRSVAVGENVMEHSSYLAIDELSHIVVVWDEPRNEVVVYLNGEEVMRSYPHIKLSENNDINNWLGRSQYPDNSYYGSYDEFRIYDSALTPSEVQTNYQLGPDELMIYDVVPSYLSPADGNVSDNLQPFLSWVSSTNEDIVENRVYLGTDYNVVVNATVDTLGVYRGSMDASETFFQVGSDLSAGTYYWRVEELLSNGETVTSETISFGLVDYQASVPVPSNGQGAIDPEAGPVNLSWTAGVGSVSHKVWFGEDALSLELLTQTGVNQASINFGLEKSTSYFWRVDEINPLGEIVEGNLWSFATVIDAEPCLTGDLTGDCVVEFRDLAILSENWLEYMDCDSFDCADIDRSQFVDMLDFALFANNWLKRDKHMIVINEIHYNPDNNTERVEFVELMNAGVYPINLGFWKLENAVDYVIPANTIIEPGEHLLIAQNPMAMYVKFGVSSLGPWEGKLSNEGEDVVLRDSDDNKIDSVEYQSQFPWPVAAGGEDASMELINPYLDNNLGGSWRSSGYVKADAYLAFGDATPGSPNSVLRPNAGPQIRQVELKAITPEPGQDKDMPRSGQSMLVTAKVSDPDGVAGVVVKVQVVEAGEYLPAYLPVPISVLLQFPLQRPEPNSEFENPANWETMTMFDDGTNGDVVAGDSVYSVVVAGKPNRTIVRYRIEATDGLDEMVRVPYYDDESLNFAAFVYDGVPDYVTTDQTVQPEGAGYTYSSDVMTSLPVYFLVTREDDIYQCNGYNSADRIDQGNTSYEYQEAGRAYNWEGCFVYDGKVYDHVKYRLRGGNGRYNYGNGGKRSMKFRFNRGSYFQAHDVYGNKYPSKWKNLVTSKMFGNHYSGRYAVNEIIDMALWNQVGVPGTDGWWFTFRVIDGAEEAPAGVNGQYGGDFWGLYLGWENYDSAYLDNHGMEKGNLYKLSDKVYEGERQQRYQNSDAVADNSDYENIRWNMNAEASADFIENHMDTDMWSRYKTVVEAIRHYDIFSGGGCYHCLKNSAWYFYPEYTEDNNYLGKLWILPYDVDDTWGTFFNRGVEHGTAAIFDQIYITESVEVPQLEIDPEKAPIKQRYRNYIREYRDLHFKPEVIDRMIEDYAEVIERILPADRDRWRTNPNYDGSRDDGSLDFVIGDMKKFAWQGGEWVGSPYMYWPGSDEHLDGLANAEGDLENIPNTPVINYIGSVDYPTNDLQFSVSDLSDPQGNETITSIKWRVAEVEESGSADSGNFINMGDEWLYFEGTEEPSAEVGAWRLEGYNDDISDTNWKRGNATIGYSSRMGVETILDMKGNYSSFYLRKTFEIVNPSEIESLVFNIMFDDGFNLWINGNHVLGDNVPQENVAFNAYLEDSGLTWNEPEGAYEEYVLSDAVQYLVEGTNQIAIHVVNVAPGSSDAFFDMQLSANLIGGFEFVNPKSYLVKRKYEINADWESEELMTFDSIKIPGAEAKTGRRYRARCKVKDNTGRWSHWSEPVEFVAGMPLGAGIVQNLRITELMYNPKAPSGSIYDDTDFEFIEFKNVGDETIDLSNVVIDSGVTFDFATGSITSLLPGEFVLVAYNQTALESKYGSVVASRIAGEYSGKLSNSGEGVSVVDYNNGTVVTFTYSDSNNWPQAADGTGHSLVPLDSALSDANIGSLSYGFNWRASSYMDGSPAADDAQLDATVMVNEICAHTDVTGYESNDWIELLNAGSSSVNLSDWYLSDDEDELAKWNIGNVTIGAGELISFDEINDFHKPDMSGFGLSKAGEKLILSYLPESGAQRIVNYIEFEGQERVTESDEQLSWGRYPDGNKWFFTTLASRDSSNSEVVEHVVIREIMYHHWQDLDILEYVMIENPTASSVSMSSEGGQWELTGDADYAFPVGSSIGANSRILVVSFDPTDLGLLQEFMSAYNLNGLTANVDVFGPWSGDLSNATAKVAIEKPLLPDAPDPEIPWVLIDRVWYFDQSPWPELADGRGKALRRLTTEADLSSTDASTWHAATPHLGL